MERSNVSESSSEEDQRVDMENTEHQTSEMEVSATVVTENQEESDDIIPPTQFDAAVKTSKLRLKNGKTVSTLVFKTTHLLAGPNKQLRISCPENYAKIIKKPIDVSKIKVPSTSADVSTSKVRKTGGKGCSKGSKGKSKKVKIFPPSKDWLAGPDSGDEFQEK